VSCRRVLFLTVPYLSKNEGVSSETQLLGFLCEPRLLWDAVWNAGESIGAVGRIVLRTSTSDDQQQCFLESGLKLMFVFSDKGQAIQFP
jgi:hypothetical protein